MTRLRVVETNQGIQGELNATMYDQMLRHLRDRGWMETKHTQGNGAQLPFDANMFDAVFTNGSLHE